MCEHGDLAWMPELGPYGRYIDKCMEEWIRDLINGGWTTLACCCGHGKYPQTVVVKVRDIIFELHSKKDIPRKKKFYKMDEDGLFYIPEVM